MKKLIALILFVGSLAIANAQITAPFYLHDKWTTNGFGVKQTYPSRDSVTSGTIYTGQIVSSVPFNYYNYDTIQIKGSYRTASILLVITKVSGTVAGTARLEGSVDGLTWTAIGADTLTLANATTNTYTWELPGRPRVSNSTTLVGAYSVRSVYTKPDYLDMLYYRVYVAATGTWCGTNVVAIAPRQ